MNLTLLIFGICYVISFFIIGFYCAYFSVQTNWEDVKSKSWFLKSQFLIGYVFIFFIFFSIFLVSSIYAVAMILK